MIVNKPSDRTPMSAEEILKKVKEMQQSDPNLRVKNAFRVGINFSHGEKIIKLLGFDYSEWLDTERDGVHGLYLVMVLQTNKAASKTLSLSSILKEKDGILMGSGDKEFRHHVNDGGLAEVMRKFQSHDDPEAMAAIVKFFEQERTVELKWLQVENYAKSMINII